MIALWCAVVLLAAWQVVLTVARVRTNREVARHDDILVELVKLIDPDDEDLFGGES